MAVEIRTPVLLDRLLRPIHHPAQITQKIGHPTQLRVAALRRILVVREIDRQIPAEEVALRKTPVVQEIDRPTQQRVAAPRRILVDREIDRPIRVAEAVRQRILAPKIGHQIPLEHEIALLTHRALRVPTKQSETVTKDPIRFAFLAEPKTVASAEDTAPVDPAPAVLALVPDQVLDQEIAAVTEDPAQAETAAHRETQARQGTLALRETAADKVPEIKADETKD